MKILEMAFPTRVGVDLERRHVRQRGVKIAVYRPVWR